MTFRSGFPPAILAATVLAFAFSASPATAVPGAPSQPTGPAELSAPSIPDVSLVDQDGKKIRFYSDLIEGKDRKSVV